jgi:hypothetical protein
MAEVDSTHPEYDGASFKWQKLRDVIAGEDTIKGNGTTYLPRLSGQSNDEYNAYRDRPEFLGATARTHEGMVGMIFRKEPNIVLPEAGKIGDSMKSLNKDADLKGNTLAAYSRKVTEEILAVGRGGTLVEWSEDEQRPTLCYYTAENILNWKTERIGGVSVASLVVLSETYTEDAINVPKVGATSDMAEDVFEHGEAQQIRVLRLIPKNLANDEGGGDEAEAAEESEGKAPELVYSVEVWRESVDSEGQTKESQWVLHERLIPNRSGTPLSFIPFIFHSADNTTNDPVKPPLLDLANLNLRHYRVTADYAHGLHYVALPTAWVAGFPADADLKIGASAAWTSEDVNAKAGFLEFTGKGLSEYTTALGRLETQMAVLGARLLEQQKREAETAEAMKIRQSGESSILAKISESGSETMTAVAKVSAFWSGLGEDPDQIESDACQVALNTDFVSSRMSGAELVQFVQAWLNGGISQATLHHNIKEGELLPPDVTPEEEAEMIANAAPNAGDDDDETGAE